MARPTKRTADYFPHFAHHGKTMFIIEERFGNDGYAFWFKLLELLCSTEGHCYDCDSVENWAFLTSKTHVSEVSATEILDTLAKLGAIDSKLWAENKVWSQNLVDNLVPLYSKRIQKPPVRPVSGEKTEFPSSENHKGSKGSIVEEVKEVKRGSIDNSFSFQNPKTKPEIDNEHLQRKQLIASAKYYKQHDEKAYLTLLKQHPELEEQEEVPFE